MCRLKNNAGMSNAQASCITLIKVIPLVSNLIMSHAIHDGLTAKRVWLLERLLMEAVDTGSIKNVKDEVP